MWGGKRRRQARIKEIWKERKGEEEKQKEEEDGRGRGGGGKRERTEEIQYVSGSRPDTSHTLIQSTLQLFIIEHVFILRKWN